MSDGRPIPGLRRPFRGNLYRVLGVATHETTGRFYVVYHPEGMPHHLWIRPLSSFTEVLHGSTRTVPRFARVEEDQ